MRAIPLVAEKPKRLGPTIQEHGNHAPPLGLFLRIGKQLLANPKAPDCFRYHQVIDVQVIAAGHRFHRPHPQNAHEVWRIRPDQLVAMQPLPGESLCEQFLREVRAKCRRTAKAADSSDSCTGRMKGSMLLMLQP